MRNVVSVIGAGLAGSEAALVLASRGIDVELREMRPQTMTPAHKTGLPAELVCSNSFKSQIMPSAPALLKEELGILDSPLLSVARKTCVPAGSALAVDREAFSVAIREALISHPRIHLIPGEVSTPPQDGVGCIIASGPLTSEALSQWLASRFSSEYLHFYDAVAPIVAADSVDMSIAFAASRWDEGSADYINCPMSDEEYRRFYDELTKADTATAREFEDKRYFEACLPLEVIASRGYQALSFGPLKPVGLRDPRTGKRPYAVVQLRKENAAGSALSLVAFQTRLTIPAQQQVFRLIPGLQNAEFLRYGSIHRNSYMDSPRLLDETLQFRDQPNLYLAGQLCGNEGYVESIATGHYAALALWGELRGARISAPPPETALGALVSHITQPNASTFSPSQFHFGLLPPLISGPKKMDKGRKRVLLCERALAAFRAWSDQVRSPDSV